MIAATNRSKLLFTMCAWNTSKISMADEMRSVFFGVKDLWYTSHSNEVILEYWGCKSELPALSARFIRTLKGSGAGDFVNYGTHIWAHSGSLTFYVFQANWLMRCSLPWSEQMGTLRAGSFPASSACASHGSFYLWSKQ